MKIVKNKHERDLNLRKVLFLRYGTEEPALEAKPIVSIGIVAELLRMPYERAKWLVRHY